MQIKSPKDFWAGLMFIGFGLFFAVWAISSYQMGTAVRMGPAYFPVVLGGLLAFLGAMVLIESFAMESRRAPRSWSFPTASTISSSWWRSSPCWAPPPT